MNNRSRWLLALSPVAVVVTAAALIYTSSSSELDRADSSTLSAPVLQAVQRDLGVDSAKANDLTSKESSSLLVEQDLRAGLGSDVTGAWIEPATGKLVVGITDPAKAGEVEKAGATPQLVSTPATDLKSTMDKLDSRADTAPAAVTSWFIDVPTNSITVLVRDNAVDQAKKFVTDSGANPDHVRVLPSDEQPATVADIRGGDAFTMPRARCSIGFSVVGGFVTAGHCGTQGTPTTGGRGAAQGTYQGSSFPGNDYAFVRTNSDWTPKPLVNDYSGGTVQVRGAAPAPVNTAVCRSGATTGWHCGRITAYNATVNYREGRVTGLIRTTVCSEPGDSGGSLITADTRNAQAQGVTSGGSGNCRSGGTTFFQPVQEILDTYKLTLVTAGSQPTPPTQSSRPAQSSTSAKPGTTTASSRPTTPNPPATTSPANPTSRPPLPENECTFSQNRYTGTLKQNENIQHPRLSMRSRGIGKFTACMVTSPGAGLDVVLEKRTGDRWEAVARGETQGKVQRLSQAVPPNGEYRMMIYATRGGGDYTMFLTTG